VRPVTSLFSRYAVASLLACGLIGCASLTRMPSTPALRLAPATLGKELSVAQHLDIEFAGQVRGVDALLEVDATQTRLAVLQLGQTVARLSWDGQTLDESLAPGWPRYISGEQVLTDLQYVWWPRAQIQAALPDGWTLRDEPPRRTLLHDGQLVLDMQSTGDGVIDMRHLDTGYRVRIRTQGDQPEFAAP